MSLLFMYLWVWFLVLSRCTANYPGSSRGYAQFMIDLNSEVMLRPPDLRFRFYSCLLSLVPLLVNIDR